MKKVRLLLTMAFAFIMATGMFGQNVMFVGEEDIASEAEIIANLETAGYTVTRVGGADFIGYAEGDFDGFDAVIIAESISSSDATGYGEIGFPLPVICLEPYVLHKSGWEFYGESYVLDAETIDDTAFDMTILDGTHPIFTGLDYTAGDEVAWTTGSEEGAHLLGMPVAGGPMGGAATALADNNALFGVMGEGYSFMWALEETPETPRMFLWGLHERYLPHSTDAFDQIILNAMEWVLGQTVSTADVEANDVSGLTISPNPAIGSTSLEVSSAAAGVATINVIDLSGNKVVSETSNFTKGANSYNLSVDALKSGIYFVAVEVAGSTSVEKLVVQ